jgi:hypothetical protein
VDFVAALVVALFSPSFLITPRPVPVFTVVVRGIFSGTLLQLATASFVLVVSVYFTGEVICRPGDEARPQDGDEVRLGSCIAHARFGRVSLFVSKQCRSCYGTAYGTIILRRETAQSRCSASRSADATFSPEKALPFI